MNWLIEYALALLAKSPRYQWGGDDPIAGFDCSGFVLELLKACGEIAHGTPKMSAQQIYNHYEKIGSSTLGPGTLAFYGSDSSRVVHMGFCLTSNLMLESGGGDSTTTTEERAIAQNAFIRMRPLGYRKDFLCTLKPAYKLLGVWN